MLFRATRTCETAGVKAMPSSFSYDLNLAFAALAVRISRRKYSRQCNHCRDKAIRDSATLLSSLDSFLWRPWQSLWFIISLYFTIAAFAAVMSHGFSTRFSMYLVAAPLFLVIIAPVLVVRGRVASWAVGYFMETNRSGCVACRDNPSIAVRARWPHATTPLATLNRSDTIDDAAAAWAHARRVHNQRGMDRIDWVIAVVFLSGFGMVVVAWVSASVASPRFDMWGRSGALLVAAATIVAYIRHRWLLNRFVNERLDQRPNPH